MVRTGTHMLEHGLLPLPEVLTRDMSVPVAYWKARQCAVVLTLAFAWYGHDQPEPMAMEVVCSRARTASGCRQQKLSASASATTRSAAVKPRGTRTSARWYTGAPPKPAR